MQEKPVIFYLFCIYATNDLIRYPYYMFKIYDLGKHKVTVVNLKMVPHDYLDKY